jgi:hypothetical protein
MSRAEQTKAFIRNHFEVGGGPLMRLDKLFDTRQLVNG